MDNRPGANGNIGANLVAKAPADGYTIMFATAGPLALNRLMYQTTPYDPTRDFAPVSLFADMPLMIVANQTTPLKTLQQAIAHARANPDKLTYASPGHGSMAHLTADLIQRSTGIKLTHVPYKTLGTVLTDLISGQVQVFFLGMVSAQSQIKGGRLRAIGVTGPKRAVAMPDVQTVAEGGAAGYEVVAWYGLFAPAGVPRAIVRRINADVKRILELPEIRDRLTGEGAEVAASTPEQFAAYIKTEMSKWSRVVKLSGARAD